MSRWFAGRGQWLAGLGGVLAGAAAVALAGVPGEQPVGSRADIEKVVHDYILAHPEIIPEAMEKLQQRQMSSAIDEHRKAIETPFAGAWAGAADGDVTLVEFFDYACGYCRASVADVDKLLAQDKKVRIVFRELPILGDDSDAAARASLSAARQGRFLDFHRAMYSGDRPGQASIAKAETMSRLDPAKLAGDKADKALSAEIASNIDLARTLGLTGTPSFIVGDKVLSGAVGYDALKQAVAEARAQKKG
jgi:protein-disulfide isomerase